jgi:hypothetical protein
VPGIVLKRAAPYLLVLAASAGLCLTRVAIGSWPSNVGPGDYSLDAAAAVDSLSHGQIGAYLAAHPVMGPFSIVLRAPFAALGSNPLSAYQWGTLPCVFALGLLGLYLARLAGRRGLPAGGQALLVTLCLLNPLTLEALRSGHPEELLTAVLAVGAVASAAEGRRTSSAILLGLALASKQWAVIAVLPVLMALPAARLRVALGAAAVAAILILPGFAADPSAFGASQANASSTHGYVDAWSIWYPFAGSVPGVVASNAQGVAGQGPWHGGSQLIGAYAHPLIVMLALLLPLGLALRRRRLRLSGAEAMALLALLALLRASLDPVDNFYYHEPALLALAGWDAFSPGRLPLRALAGLAAAALLWRWHVHLPDEEALNALYLAIVVPATIAIGLALFRTRAAARKPLELRPAALPGTVGAG